MKDICRIVSFTSHKDRFKYGFVIWLTNDPYYWNAPSRPNVGYADFSVHHGAMKSGTMRWGSSVGAGTTGGREEVLRLRNEYEVAWNEYSGLGLKSGAFKIFAYTY